MSQVVLIVTKTQLDALIELQHECITPHRWRDKKFAAGLVDLLGSKLVLELIQYCEATGEFVTVQTNPYTIRSCLLGPCGLVAGK
jgi:hypothetical protein